MIKIIAAVMLSAGLVFAQDSTPPKNKKHTHSRKKVTEESRGGKIKELSKKTVVVPVSKMAFQEKKSYNFNDIKPPKNLDFYSQEDKNHSEYEKALDSQISELYALTRKMKNEPTRGELWLRLGEHYIEKANILNDRLQTEYDKQLQAFQSGQTTQTPKLDLSQVKVFNKKAIELNQWFIRDFPNDEKTDQALFYIAYENMELGNGLEGVNNYKQLVTKFPQSKFAGDAHFNLGETFFENEKWEESIVEYNFLLKDSKSDRYLLALYKSAWCYFALGKTEQAITNMSQIIHSETDMGSVTTNGGKKIDKLRLTNEATKDLIIFFAETKDMPRAIAYFKKLNGPDWQDNLVKLAYRVTSKGFYENAKVVFKYLISLDEMSEKNFDYQYQIVQNFYFLKNNNEFKKELFQWIKDYGTNTKWYSLHQNKTEFIQKCDDLRELTLRNYILLKHQEAQNSHGQDSMLAAQEGYTFYFTQQFKNAPTDDEMHFFYGELLYDLGHYSQASVEYEFVTNKTPPSKHAEVAAKNLMISLEKVLPKDEELQKLADKTIEPIELSEIVKKFITTANWYLENYPKADKIAEIKFRVGRLYYQTNNFAQAEIYFKEIIQNYPKTKLSEYSANLLLDIYSIKKDYVGLEKMGNELLTDQSIKNTKLGDDIRGVVEKASFIKAQNLETKNNFSEAAVQFQKFAEENSNSKLVVAAYFNAGVNFDRAGNSKNAIDCLQHVMISSSDEAKKLKLQSKKLLVKLYQDSGQFELAQKLYSELAIENPASDPLTKNYLFNSALMLELIGKTEQAIIEYTKYRAFLKNEDEQSELLFKVTELSRKLNLKNRALPNYDYYISRKTASPEKKIEAHYWIYKLTHDKYEASDFKKTETSIKKITETLVSEKKSVGWAFLAKLKLIQAEDIFEKLKDITMPDKPQKQKVAVEKKLEFMNKLSDKLEEIIKLDSSEEIITALNMFAQANENVVQTFNQAPLPKELDADKLELYKAEIDKITAPFAAKAEESYKLSIERARNLKVYNAAYQDSYNKMSAKFPKDYFKSTANLKDSQQFAWPEFSNASDNKKSELENAITEKNNEKIRLQSIEALKLNSKNIYALNALAIDYSKKNQPEAALSLLNKALAVEPQSAEVHNNIALIYLNRKQEREALQSLTKALEFNPENKIVASNLALIYIQHSDFDKVLSVLEKPVKSGGASEESLYYYAVALTAKDKKDEASAIFEKIHKPKLN